MMRILAIETSTDACSVAILDEERLYQRHEIAPQQHAQLVLSWISTLLDEASLSFAQIDAIAYSCGPGSFTGIRIGAAIAQGITFGAGTPIIAVPSLCVIAQGVHREFGKSQVLVIQDARMQQVYYGHYILNSDGIMASQYLDKLCSSNELHIDVNTTDYAFVSDALSRYPELDNLIQSYSFSMILENYYPNAQDVAKVAKTYLMEGKVSIPQESLPIYLRNADAWKKI